MKWYKSLAFFFSIDSNNDLNETIRRKKGSSAPFHFKIITEWERGRVSGSYYPKEFYAALIHKSLSLRGRHSLTRFKQNFFLIN